MYLLWAGFSREHALPGADPTHQGGMVDGVKFTGGVVASRTHCAS